MGSRDQCSGCRLRCCVRTALVVISFAAPVQDCPAAITIQQISGTDWKIGNGDLNVVFDPAANKITSVAIGASSNLLDPSNSQLYPEFAGTPFGSGTQTSGFQQSSNYIDFWTTTASTGTSTNPITYSFHYVMFNNDPNIVVYEVLNHSATDPATSVGQGQFLRTCESVLNLSTRISSMWGRTTLGRKLRSFPRIPIPPAATSKMPPSIFREKVWPVIGETTFTPNTIIHPTRSFCRPRRNMVRNMLFRRYSLRWIP